MCPLDRHLHHLTLDPQHTTQHNTHQHEDTQSHQQGTGRWQASNPTSFLGHVWWLGVASLVMGQGGRDEVQVGCVCVTVCVCLTWKGPGASAFTVMCRSPSLPANTYTPSNTPVNLISHALPPPLMPVLCYVCCLCESVQCCLGGAVGKRVHVADP